MEKYSVILEFGGGTYISQILCKNIGDAPCKWMDSFLKDRPLRDETDNFIQSFANENNENGLLQIDDCPGVWIFVFEHKGIEARGHFVLTAF